MPEKKTFYDVNNYCDRIEPGKRIEITRSIEAWAGHYDLSPLIGLPEKELVTKQKESVRQEKQAYEALRKSTVGWEEQAGQTLLLDRALEYVRTAEVKHTSNKWTHMADGSWEISNRVYKMWYRFTDESGGALRVTWHIQYNVPRQPEHGLYTYQFTGETIEIAGQNNKPYENLEAAQRYIQGRFDLYADHFTELSPPIPDKEKRMFSVNGHLLPGYTVEPQREAVVAELMDFLEDSDTPAPPKALPKPKAKAAKPHKKPPTLSR